MPGVIRKLWRIAAGLFAAAVILAALLVGALRLALVQAPEYREQVEARVSEALGRPVQLGGMDARLGLRGPEINFTDARIMNLEGDRSILRAASGALQFDAWSLLRGQLHPGSVSLRGVRLRVQRDAGGAWRLLGSEGPQLLELGMRDGGWPRVATLPPGRLELQDLEVQFEDRQQDVGPLSMQLDQLDLEISEGRLTLSADGRLPAALGSSIKLSATMRGQDARGRPSEWNIGVSAAELDLAAAGRLAGRPDLVPAAGSVTGSLSASADSDGLLRVAGDVAAKGLQLPPAVAPGAPGGANYQQLGGSLEWRRGAFGWELELSNLSVERDGRDWRSDRVLLAFEQAASQAESPGGQYRFSADRLHLEDLVPLAHGLPEEARSTVFALAPRGVLLQLEARLGWPLESAADPELRIATRFENLSLEPLRPVPGLSALSGEITGDTDGGNAQVRGAGARVELPWLFRESIALQAASLDLAWSRSEEGLRLRVDNLEMANEDATVSASGHLEIPGDDASPRLELEAIARDVRLEAVPGYLPVAIMPDGIVRWLDSALRAGSVAEARAVFRGATRDFPFREDEGLFKVEFDIAGGELDFRPGWPSVRALAASVRFENEGLWAEVRDGRLLEVAAGPARVAIPDLAQGRLGIEGEAQGALAAFREFALGSNFLARILGPGLAPAEVRAGQASADLELSLPLRSIRDARARVDLQISGGTVAYGFLGEPVRDIDARINIDTARVTAREITASLAGNEFSADITVAEDGAIRLAGGGAIDAGGLARVLRLPIDTWARGTTDWRGYVQFPAPGSLAPLSLEFSSQLEGIGIELPEPLRKSADQARQLRVTAAFPESDLVDAELVWDESLSIKVRVDRSGPEGVLLAVPGVVSGAPAGLAFSGAITELDLRAWMEAELAVQPESGGFPWPIAGGRVLVGRLSAPWLTVDDLLLDVTRGDDHWRMELNAMQVEGTLEVPFAPYGDEPVTVRLGRLWMDGGQSPGEQQSPGAGSGPSAAAGSLEASRAPVFLDPAWVPPMDIEVQDMRYGEIRLGSVSARVLHEEDGFELIGLEGTGDGFIVQAEGGSRLSETVDESRLGVSIKSDDLGATLDYMGFRRSMEAEKASFEADVHWTGGLRSDWLAAIAGEASIRVEEGTLVGIEPGAGRVFGLLSVQALPRRLALDFKDVFGEGTSFDRIKGDFRFEDGNAYTDNLVMQGPAAEMVVVGRTGLVARDYDQKVVIAADLGRTLPVAGTVVGGPAVGAALFLLSEILSKPFETQVTYQLSGSWQDPVVERLGAGAVPPPGGASHEMEGSRP